MGLVKCFLPQQLESGCGPTATLTSQKTTWTKVLIKHFKESGLAPESMLRTQRSRLFPKPKKRLIFGILANGGTPWKFLESFNFTNGWKWHILCKLRRWWGWCNGKVTVTITCWAMSIFVSQLCPRKWAWKSAFYRNNWNAAAGQRQLWRHWKLLGMRVLIKHFRKRGLAPETMLRTQHSRQFLKTENWLIFGILAKGGPHENFLESFNFTNGWKRHILCKMRRWWPWCSGKMAVTIICWAMSLFISQICPPKCAWKSGFYRNNLNAAAGQRRLQRQWKKLGMKVFIKHFQKAALLQNLCCVRKVAAHFLNLKNGSILAF